MKSRIGIHSIAFALMALLGLVGCGGGTGIIDNNFAPGEQVPKPVSGFSVTQLDTGANGGFATTEVSQNSQLLVEIHSTGDAQARGLYLELAYDASRYTPLVAQVTDALAPRADSLVLEMLDTPGIVAIGQVPVNSAAQALAPGALVAEVLFDDVAFSGANASRAASMVPVDARALSPLVWDEDSGQLHWYFVHPGDYDQNGEVGVSDLAPLGRLFGEAGPFAFESENSVVDGNRDGLINVQDLTTIGQRYLSLIQGYNLYASADINDVPVTYDAVSTIAPLGSYLLPEADDTGSETRLRFSYTPDPAEYALMFWARPFANMGGSEMEGTRSNLNGPQMNIQLPPGGPGDVSDPGYNFTPLAALTLNVHGSSLPLPVTLDASASNDIDGYIAFFEWDFEGDGLFDAFGSMPTIEHTYLMSGTYSPVVRVTDNNGAWASFTSPPFEVTAVLVSNIEPFADLFATLMTGYAPLTVGFLGSGSFDVDGHVTQYLWDFDGDGEIDLESGNDPSVLHTFTAPGSFDAMLTVVDNRGGLADASITIDVMSEPVNDPPQVVLEVRPSIVFAPQEVELDAAGSSDPDGGIVEYAWDVNGDGSYDNFTESSTFSYTYNEPGLYDVGLRVTDTGGLSSHAQQVLIVNVHGNTMPEANLQATPSAGDAPLFVSFDASGSSDADGAIVRYDFDFDSDGVWDAYDSEANISWTYNSPGSFVARLRVTDEHGAQSAAQLMIEANALGNAMPVASLTATPSSGNTPLTIALDASASSDADGGIVNYEWDFNGDGLYDSYGPLNAVNYTFTTPGNHEVWMRVTDNSGAQATTQASIAVTDPVNQSPLAGLAASPDNGLLPLVVSFDASSSSDADGTIVMYEWDFNGDGLFDGYSEQNYANYTYYMPGAYSARVRVTDDGGSQDTTQVAVTVTDPTNQSPNASLIIAPPAGPAPLSASLDASGSLDPDGSIVEYEWDFDGDGLYDGYGAQAIANHTYYAPGSFNARVRVTDNGGSQDTAQFLITVTGSAGGQPPTASFIVTPPGGNILPLEIQFNPAASFDIDGSIERYDWDYDGNGVWDAYTYAPIVVAHTYTAGNSYTAKLRVTDDDGLYNEFSTTFDVSGPPIAVLDADTTSGPTGTTVNFDASNSSDPGGSIVLYEWDLDGNGSFETNTGATPTTSHTYNSEDDYNTQLRVTDNNGATDTDTLMISIRFADVTMVDDQGLPGVSYLSLAIIGGNPAIAYQEGNADDLKYVRAANSTGSSWGTPVTIISIGNVGNDVSLAEVNGRPAIAYIDNGDDTLRYVRALDATGSSWPSSAANLFSGSNPADPTLRVIDGVPAIGFKASQTQIHFKKASNADGSSWAGSWQTAVTLTDIGGVKMEVVNGKPAFAFRQYVLSGNDAFMKYCIANNSNGTSWAAIQTIASETSSINLAIDFDLAVLGTGAAARPAVIFDEVHSTQALWYAVASNIDGSSWGAPVQFANDDHNDPELAFVNGVPVAVYFNDSSNQLKIRYGADIYASSWGIEQTIDPAGDAGDPHDLINLNDKAAVAYFEGNQDELKFARVF